MRRAPLLALVALAGILAGCTDRAPTAPATAGSGNASGIAPSANGSATITVMTRNLSIGTDIGIVLGAPPAQIPIAVATAYGFTVGSRPPERMTRIADEIADARPDVVGLQEVELFRIQRPGDFLIGNPTPATRIEYDFLEVILEALRERGARYRVAAVVRNTDTELPMLIPGAEPVPRHFADVRLVDRDVILVREGVRFQNGQGANYAAGIPITIGPISFTFMRGWTSVDVRRGDQWIRVFNTHLETQGAVPVQVAQADELLAIAATSPYPTVLLGDFNSAANPSAPPDKVTPTYGMVLAAGYTDAWPLAHPNDEGLTCCHFELDLRDITQPFTQRIDFVFFRALDGVTFARIVGEELPDRTPSGLWPSDHAGVVAGVGGASEN
jgi:endonuclease/exonuclease/phosphatase family metal-dependent hydrolase